MEVFRNLYISADVDRMIAAVEEIERAMPTGWSRNRHAEAYIPSAPFWPVPIFCFTCTAEGPRPAANLFLLRKDERTYQVSNITSVGRPQLSRGEYNVILEDFLQKVFRPYADPTGLEYTLTDAQVDLENCMTVPTAVKLRQFSGAANKGTGSSHPRDRERWNDFVLSAHRERCVLDPSTLRRWLTEVEGWPFEVADQLAVEYEYGRELLAFAEGRRSA